MKKSKRIILLIFCVILLTASAMLISSCELEKDDGIYTASFYADGKLVEKIEFKKGDTTLNGLPIVPKKNGLVGGWENFTLKDKDIRINAVYAESFKIKVIADDPFAISFEGETDQTIDSKNPRFKTVKIKPADGYKIDYYEIDGIKYNKVNITLSNINADMTIVVYARHELDELPIISIDTNGAGIKSKETYTTMTFDLENCDGELKNIDGGIRLRGNSTLSFPKKAYRIKFEKKQSLFGLEKAKSWVLLADYIDPSSLHNHAAMTIAKQMPGLSFTTTPIKVNVYLNGVYQGIYTLCEQVQENEGRMNIEMPAITEDMNDFKDYNWFVSLDLNCRTSGLVENEQYIAIDGHGNVHFDTMYFEIKYPEKQDFPSEEQFKWFVEELRDCLENLLDDFDSKNVKNIKKTTNVNSLIDYVIIDEITGQEDHDEWHKSFNIYYTSTSKNPEENNKINFGPIWDYDWCLNTPWTGKPNEAYKLNDDIKYFGPFYNVMFEVDEFYKLLKQRYNKYAKPALKAYLEEYDALVDSMTVSMEKNAELWYGKLDKEIVSKNIKFLKDYLTNRYELLNKEWKN